MPFQPPTYRKIVGDDIPPAGLYPIALNEQSEVLYWQLYTPPPPRPGDNTTLESHFFQWLPQANRGRPAGFQLLDILTNYTIGGLPSAPRHGFDDSGRFAVVGYGIGPGGRLPPISSLSAATWTGAGWLPFFSFGSAPHLADPGNPSTVYDRNAAGDMVLTFRNPNVNPSGREGYIVDRSGPRFWGGNIAGMFDARSGTTLPFFTQNGRQSVPRKLNNRGQVVGIYADGPLPNTVGTPPRQSAFHGFTGTFGSATDFTPISPRGGVVQPTGINDAGEIVGFAGNFVLGWAPFLYLPAPNYGLPAGLQEIGPPTRSKVEPEDDTSVLAGNRTRFFYPPHEALINAAGLVIYNYVSESVTNSFTDITVPGLWQCGHHWTLQSLVNNLASGEAVLGAADLNNRGEILAQLAPVASIGVLRPLLGAQLALIPGTCPGDPFTVKLTLTNQSGGTLTQLASPGLEWHGPGNFSILQGPTVVGPGALPAGQTGVLTWLVQLPADSNGGSFISQGTALDAANVVVNSLLAQSPTGIAQNFGTEVTATPKRVGNGDEIEVHLTVINGLAVPLTNVRPNGVPTPAGTGGAHFKSGPLPAGAVTLNPGARFTFTNVFIASQPGAVTFSGGALGTTPQCSLASTTGTSLPVVIAPGELLIKRAVESPSLYSGAGIFQTVPIAPQIKTNVVGANEVSQFQVKVINSDPQPQTFTLIATPLSGSGWKRTYLLSGTDTTAQLEGPGGGALPTMAPGSSLTLDVALVATNAAPGDVIRIDFTLGLVSDPTVTMDAVETVSELANEIVVNSTGDLPNQDPSCSCCNTGQKLRDGVTPECTLRAAIQAANKHPGKDIIKFRVPVDDPGLLDGIPTIKPATALPEITDSVRIDGWSQNPSSDLPPVEVSGIRIQRPPEPPEGDTLSWPGAANGFDIPAEDCELRGFVITHFPLCGILLRGGRNTIQGCHLGIAFRGTLPAANGLAGVEGKGYRGAGIAIVSSSNLIGGTAPKQANLISGRSGSIRYGLPFYQFQLLGPGVLIQGPTALANRIEGNIIGLDASGTTLPSLPILGVDQIDSAEVISAVAGVFINSGAKLNVIGGNRPEARNIISGNLAAVEIVDATDNQIAGNYIGVDITGKKAIYGRKFNGASGIGVLNGANNTIGGPRSGEGNLIGGDLLTGISVDSGQASQPNLIQNNLIGATAAGERVGYQSYGVTLSSAQGTVIKGNGIAFSLSAGVQLAGNLVQITIEENSIHDNDSDGINSGAVLSDSGVTIYRNSIYSNGNNNAAHPAFTHGIFLGGASSITVSENSISNNIGLGLSLSSGGRPTPNDFGDFDTGPNTLLNLPVVNHPVAGLGGTRIRASLDTSVGVHPYTIEFFANEKVNPTGYGEGQRFLGSANVKTDFSGSAVFDFTAGQPAFPGEFLTATATDSAGNTSEFSKAVLIQGPTETPSGISAEVQNQAPPPFHSNGGKPGRVRAQGNPLSGDGNGDGLLDSQQPNVCSFPGIAGKWLTLAAPGGTTLVNVQPGGPPDFTSLPSGYSFPVGFLSFGVTGLAAGTTVSVTNIFHDAIAYTTVFAYGPTPENTQPHWYEFLFDGTSGATPGADQMVLTFRDGRRGDHDLQTNGVLTTLLAPAYLVPPGPTLRLLSNAVSLVHVLDLIGGDATNAPVLTTNQMLAVTSVLGWPASDSNYLLEYTDNLSPTTVWRPLFNQAVVLGNQQVVTNTSVDPLRFYRLRRFGPVFLEPAAPVLNIRSASANSFLLSWPSSATSFALQHNSDPTTTHWVAVRNPVSIIGDQHQVILPPPTGARFYRLKSP